jgi:hypothetical protein
MASELAPRVSFAFVIHITHRALDVVVDSKVAFLTLVESGPNWQIVSEYKQIDSWIS